MEQGLNRRSRLSNHPSQTASGIGHSEIGTGDDYGHDPERLRGHFSSSNAPDVPDGWFPWSTYCTLHDIPPGTPRSWALNGSLKKELSIRTRDDEARDHDQPDFKGWLLNAHLVEQLVDSAGLAYFWDKFYRHPEFVACGHCQRCRERRLEEGWYVVDVKRKRLDDQHRPLILQENLKDRTVLFGLLDRIVAISAPHLLAP